MWIFLSEAFVSIVEDNKCADLVLVRARREKHLQNFLTAEMLNELSFFGVTSFSLKVLVRCSWIALRILS